MRTGKTLFTLAAASLLAGGCTKTPETDTAAGAASKPAETTEEKTGPVTDASLSVGELVAEKEGIKISKLAGSPRFEAAKLFLRKPSFDAEVDGRVKFEFEVTGYELGRQTVAEPFLANSGKGQHIHFIVDNGPYDARYEPVFEKELEPGTHVILAFLSRSYHESVKHDYVLTRVHVGGEKDAKVAEVELDEAPHLFYSRPKGTYSGDGAKKLLLDFYPVNAPLSKEGYKVAAKVGGQTFTLTEWVPYVVEGLSMGEQTIELQLMGKDGAPVSGPFTKVSRTFTLE